MMSLQDRLKPYGNDSIREDNQKEPINVIMFVTTGTYVSDQVTSSWNTKPDLKYISSDKQTGAKRSVSTVNILILKTNAWFKSIIQKIISNFKVHLENTLTWQWTLVLDLRTNCNLFFNLDTFVDSTGELWPLMAQVALFMTRSCLPVKSLEVQWPSK